MSDSGIVDTGNVPEVPVNITSTEGIANTGEPENIGTGETGTENIDTQGNTSITISIDIPGIDIPCTGIRGHNFLCSSNIRWYAGYIPGICIGNPRITHFSSP